MEDSKRLDPHDEFTEKEFKKNILSIKKDNTESISNNKLNENDDSRINLTENIIEIENNKIVEDKISGDKKKIEFPPKLNENIVKNNINIEKSNGELIKEKISKNNKFASCSYILY